jgi:hypothetical protein
VGRLTDETVKKTMLLQQDINGKYKVFGCYKISTEDGEVGMVTYPDDIFGGPCGIEFDNIEYVDEHRDYRNPLLGQPDLTHIEYRRA